MPKSEFYETDNLELITVLDEAVRLAAKRGISECELISQLLARLTLVSDKCRSSVHITTEPKLKKLFDDKAGP